MQSYKRPSSSSRSPSPQQTPKAPRTALPPHSSSTSNPRQLLCTLPPTCNPPNTPTSLASTKDLETHYATYHAHVCEERGCGCVFPEARLLELHQTECHDPIAAVRRERGEKIFECHLPTCARLFETPKGRRLHLIQAHGYPKEYFFAVTNKGVGGLLKKWGEGASMIRGQWKSRDGHNEDGSDEGDENNVDTDIISRSEGRGDGKLKSWLDTPIVEESSEDESHLSNKEKERDGIASLADAMGSLSLVPQTIRFGRGARQGGHSHHPHTHTINYSSNQVRPEIQNSSMGVDSAIGNTSFNPYLSQNTENHPRSRPPPPRGLGGGTRGGFPGRGNISSAGVRGRGIAGGRGRGRSRGMGPSTDA